MLITRSESSSDHSIGSPELTWEQRFTQVLLTFMLTRYAVLSILSPRNTSPAPSTRIHQSQYCTEGEKNGGMLCVLNICTREQHSTSVHVAPNPQTPTLNWECSRIDPSNQRGTSIRLIMFESRHEITGRDPIKTTYFGIDSKKRIFWCRLGQSILLV